MVGRLRIGIKNGLYGAVVVLCLLALKVFFRIRIRGRENVERGAEYIAVARHRSMWDAPVLAVGLGATNRIHFIARTGLMRRNPVVQALIRTFSTIIDRENFGKRDFRNMLAAMKRERIIGLFPEGTTRAQVDAKAGAIHFARLSGKRLLPVNIISDGPYPPKYPFRFPRLTVSIGESFTVSSLSANDDNAQTRAEQYQEMSEQLMLRVDNA